MLSELPSVSNGTVIHVIITYIQYLYGEERRQNEVDELITGIQLIRLFFLKSDNVFTYYIQ